MFNIHRSTRILAIEMTFNVTASFSLKDKRRLRQRLIERLKNHYNISVIESSRQDDYRVLDLTAAYVAIDESTAELMQGRFEETVLNLTEGEAELVAFDAEIL